MNGFIHVKTCRFVELSFGSSIKIDFVEIEGEEGLESLEEIERGSSFDLISRARSTFSEMKGKCL